MFLSIAVMLSCAFAEETVEDNMYLQLYRDADIRIDYYKGKYELKKPKIDGIDKFEQIGSEKFSDVINQYTGKKEIAWVMLTKSKNKYSKNLIAEIITDLTQIGFERVIFQQATGFAGFLIVYDTHTEGTN